MQKGAKVVIDNGQEHKVADCRAAVDKSGFDCASLSYFSPSSGSAEQL